MACSWQVTSASMLYGIFYSNHSVGRDVILVLPNGVYIHKFEHNTADSFIDHGRWRYGFQSQGCKGIEFEGFKFSNNKYNVYGPRGDWWVCPETTIDGSVLLTFDPDLIYYFKKSKSKN
jgi:hypothetical protein